MVTQFISCSIIRPSLFLHKARRRKQIGLQTEAADIVQSSCQVLRLTNIRVYIRSQAVNATNTARNDDTGHNIPAQDNIINWVSLHYARCEFRGKRLKARCQIGCFVASALCERPYCSAPLSRQHCRKGSPTHMHRRKVCHWVNQSVPKQGLNDWILHY